MGFDGIFNLLDWMVLGFGFYAMYSAWVTYSWRIPADPCRNPDPYP